MNKAVYAGSFDPLTLGHLDIIKRSAKLYDKLIIAVATNTNKNIFLTLDEKVSTIQETIDDEGLSNVKVVKFTDGLIVDFAQEHKANVLIRGLRSTKDFEYENEIDSLNKTQAPNLETVYLMASKEVRPISSTIVREIAHFNGDLSTLVPRSVNDLIKSKLK